MIMIPIGILIFSCVKVKTEKVTLTQEKINIPIGIIIINVREDAQRSSLLFWIRKKCKNDLC